MKKEISPKESQVTNSQEWANRVEEILRKWLLDQPYSTKLAFVLLDGCRLASDFPQAVFNEISGKYKAEVIDAAEELPGTLVNIEIFLTGIAADMVHSEDRAFGPFDKYESDKEDTAKSIDESDENESTTNPSERDNSNERVNAKPINEQEKGKSKSV